MVIYGVALLSGCYLAGQIFGILLGNLLNINTNVGGVGFAMIFLILISDWSKKKGFLPKASEQGVAFWAAMYIPIVVAMSSIQNVVSALSGGIVAILAGILATGISMLLVPDIVQLKNSNDQKSQNIEKA